MRSVRMWIVLGAALPLLVCAAPARAGQRAAGDGATPAVCVPAEQVRGLAGCPPAGPGAYLLSAAAAGLPYPLPAVTVTATAPYRRLTPHAYGRVVTPNAPVYRHPLEALAGLAPMRRFEPGFDFVSLVGSLSLAGRDFFQVNAGEYMRAEDVEEVRPSGFLGAFFAAPPAGPVGWMIASVPVSAAPGAAPAPDAPIAARYQGFQRLGVQRVGDWDWYEIAPGQWVEQRAVALVEPAPPPGAPADVIAVNTYEQSMGVYRGGQLIFATLVSSGSRSFPTRPGTFTIWAKLDGGRMSGAYRADRRDYYDLEDVPWILYYDGDRALHGAYWHDNFGIRSSHGCVNLSPRDARWLHDFAQVGDTVVIFSARP